jgi:peptide/nickel transport system substrate-binding protein
MAETRCSQCNAINREAARFCAECGAPLVRSVTSSASGSPPQPAVAPKAAPAVGESASPHPAGPASKNQAESSTHGTGRVLQGRYRIECELGRGGFGAVYSAWDTNVDRQCAVKENLEMAAEGQRQFSREATVLANLSHPNLPRVTDHFSIPGQGQYLVMDFVEGEDLGSLVNRQGKIPIEQALSWMIQVADALAYIHSQQPPVLHRDIKPANIRVTPAGQAMLVDFGLVKIFNPGLQTTLGARAVTPGYAPPEQYGLGRTDHRTDLYALGATLYTLLTGKEPLESVQRVAGSQMVPAHVANPAVSPKLEGVVERAMALEPSRRYQSASEFKAALRECQADTNGPLMVVRVSPPPLAPTMQLAEPALPGPAVRSFPAQKSQVKRKTPWLWIGLGALIFAGFLGMAVLGGLYILGSMTGTATPAAHAGVTPGVSTPGAVTPGAFQGGETPAAPTPLPVVHSKDPQSYLFLTGAEPDTLDPALSYSQTGNRVSLNVYESLIFYEKENPNVFVPQLALVVPSRENGGISSDGRVYQFKIRPGVKFHNGSELTSQDVVYSFQRGILQGGSGSPQWLFTEPLLGSGIYDIADLVDPGLVDNPAGLAKADSSKLGAACSRVQDAIKADDPPGTVTFNLAQPWAPFLATLATTNGSILSKAWVIDNGGWDGDCSDWAKFYGRTTDDLNKTKLGSSANGTGPYVLDHWDVGKEIVLRSNEAYWRREPAWPGAPTGNPAIKEVTIRYIPDFETRSAMLHAGEADSIDLDTNADWSGLDQITGLICSQNDQNCHPSDKPDASLEMIRGNPSVTRTDILFTWQINTDGGNDLIGSGKLDGNGIPPDFFGNIHVRRAFAYCFNYNTYLDKVMAGEGIRSLNLMLPGMIGYNPDSPAYNYDPGRCADEFKQATFGGLSVWDAGFQMVIPYTKNSLMRKTIADIFQHELTSVNGKLKVDTRELDDYFTRRRDRKLPLYTSGWFEDIHDPHNWLYPYTLGIYASYQGLPADLQKQFKDFLIRGVEATDPAQREEIYHGFNQLYYDQAPAILLFLPMERHYQQRWVNGWYDNPAYPGLYFYVLRKD